MFENKTYANIMAEMMEYLPDGVDTSEGSLLWNTCSKLASQLEEFYDDMTSVYDNILVDTQDLEHLIASGAECGLPIIEATNAVFKAQFNIAVELTTRFEHTEKDYTYYVTECIDDTNHIYKIECEDGGAEPNTSLGDIEPIEFLEGFETGEILELIEPGEDEESEDDYRYRRLNSFESKPFAGNKSYYIQEVGNIEGVGGVKVYRPSADSPAYVSVVITSANYTAPTTELVTAVQEAVDPNDGTGDGIAPIGTNVTVSGATEHTIAIGLGLTYATDYTYEGLKSYIEAAIDGYLMELGKTWADTDTLIVRKSRIEMALLEIEGIEDVTSVTLDSVSENLTLTNELPKRGVITIV